MDQSADVILAGKVSWCGRILQLWINGEKYQILVDLTLCDSEILLQRF